MFAAGLQVENVLLQEPLLNAQITADASIQASLLEELSEGYRAHEEDTEGVEKRVETGSK